MFLNHILEEYLEEIEFNDLNLISKNILKELINKYHYNDIKNIKIQSLNNIFRCKIIKQNNTILFLSEEKNKIIIKNINSSIKDNIKNFFLDKKLNKINFIKNKNILFEKTSQNEKCIKGKYNQYFVILPKNSIFENDLKINKKIILSYVEDLQYINNDIFLLTTRKNKNIILNFIKNFFLELNYKINVNHFNIKYTNLILDIFIKQNFYNKNLNNIKKIKIKLYNEFSFYDKINILGY